MVEWVWEGGGGGYGEDPGTLKKMDASDHRGVAGTN